MRVIRLVFDTEEDPVSVRLTMLVWLPCDDRVPVYDKILVDVIVELWVSQELWVFELHADILGDKDSDIDEDEEEDSNELAVLE